jgi:DNA polymerase-3 subunit alpha
LVNNFISLHNHSNYSLLDSVIKVESFPKWAKENNYTAIGITEHGNIFSQIKFYKSCLENNIKPILGCEVYVTDDISVKDKNSKYHHLVLIVKNEEGRINLNKLISRSYLEGFYYKPRISNKLLEEYKNGLIVCSACLGSEIDRLLFNNEYDKAKELVYYYKNIFNDDYYLEMQAHDIDQNKIVNKLILKLANETNVPFIITNDAHYLKGQQKLHSTFIQISQERDVEELYSGCYLMTIDEIHEIMDEQIGVENTNIGINNTVLLSDKCNVEIKLYNPELPKTKMPDNYNSEEEYIKELINRGFKEKILNKHPKEEINKYLEKTKYEYEIISKKGFLGYFLIVKDFIEWAENNNILIGAARGSAAGSLISYLLGITKIDPLKYNLLFERFLNPERNALPDIDVDIASDGKQDVVNYLKEKYGYNNVAQIGNFLTLGTKAVLKDIGKVLDIPYNIRDNIARLIPEKVSIKEALEQSSQLQLFEKQYPELFEYAIPLEETPKSFSVHPCGVVVGLNPINNYTALALSKNKEEVLHTEMHSSEDIGLVKIDLLGIETLSLLSNILKLTNKTYNELLHPDNIDFNDQKTWELLRNGHTDGVFQLQSPGMKDVLKEFQPSSIEDLSVINATYRPALLSLGIDKLLISRKKDPSTISYLHPDLESLLKHTYGIMLYQEEFMQISKVMAGFTDAESDVLRKAAGS